MNDSSRIDTPSVRRHKRQFAWQILVPMIAAAAIIIAAFIFVWTRGTSTDRVAADISVLWLLIPVIMILFFLLVLAAGLIYGTAVLTRIIPAYSRKVQDILAMVERGVRKAADGSTKPFLWLDQAGAAIKSIFKKKKK